jgi:hypothetical protein
MSAPAPLTGLAPQVHLHMRRWRTRRLRACQAGSRASTALTSASRATSVPPAGYLAFRHGVALPEALLQSAFADYKQWSTRRISTATYTCGAKKQLNVEVGDLEQRVVAVEVWATRGGWQRRCAAAVLAWFVGVWRGGGE